MTSMELVWKHSVFIYEIHKSTCHWASRGKKEKGKFEKCQGRLFYSSHSHCSESGLLHNNGGDINRIMLDLQRIIVLCLPSLLFAATMEPGMDGRVVTLRSFSAMIQSDDLNQPRLWAIIELCSCADSQQSKIIIKSKKLSKFSFAMQDLRKFFSNFRTNIQTLSLSLSSSPGEKLFIQKLLL